MPQMPPVRPALLQLQEYVPGKSIAEVCAVHGLSGAIKLASNENPLGPSPLALCAAQEELLQCHRYPQGHAPDLAAAVAREWAVSTDQLIFSNGSDEMIQMVALSWLNPGEELLTCAPTFSEYRFAAQLVGGSYRTVPLTEGRFDLDGLLEALRPETKIVVLCNPNNPTGTWLTSSEIERFLEKLPPDVLLVVDQAYAEFAVATAAKEPIDLFDQLHRRNLLLLRTFSKLFGLAGLRIGYAIGHSSLIKSLYKVKQPFNLGQVSQAAAVAALSDHTHRHNSLELVRTGLLQLQSAFEGWGWEYYPTAANFIAVRPGEGGAESLVKSLEAEGVIIRWLKSFGMEEWVRVTVGSSDENRLFLEKAAIWRLPFVK